MQARTEMVTDHFQFSVEIKLEQPMNNLHPEYIQAAVKRLITNHPHAFRGNSPEEILQNIWVSLKNKPLENTALGRESSRQLPIVTEKQRQAMSRALHELGDDDLEWTNDIIVA